MYDYWHNIRHFKPSEFDSPDEPGSGAKMDKKLVEALEAIRKEIKTPMKVNSGYRSKLHNKRVGGVSNSQHTQHKAADIHIDSQEIGDMIETMFDALMNGEGGIGRYNTFIHLDSRSGRARWDNR